jgi:hypothetical protein
MSICFLNHPNTKLQGSRFKDWGKATCRVEALHSSRINGLVRMWEFGKFRLRHLPQALSFLAFFKDHPACFHLTYSRDVRDQVAYAFRQVYNSPFSL